MDGFITESVNKISDGIGNAISLLLYYALTTLIIIPIRNFWQGPGVLIYILILLALAGFELNRTLITRTSEPSRAWHGMAAGLFFWQVIRFTAEMNSSQIFHQTGLIFWVMAVIFTAILWKKVLPVGLRSTMLVFLACWLGRLYQEGYTRLANWPPLFQFGYEAIRWLVGILGLVALLMIIFRTRDLNSRIYCAVTIFVSILFLALAF
jgi:hypothetical protein